MMRGPAVYQDPFGGMETVDVTGMRLPRVGEGMHVLKVKRCTMPRDKVAFIVEFEVLKSTNVSQEPGSARSVYISSQYPESLKRSVKALVSAIYGFDPKDEAGQVAFSPYATDITRLALSEANILEGRTVGCEATPGKNTSKKTGERFLDYAWSAVMAPGPLPPPMPAQTPGAAAPYGYGYAPAPAAPAMPLSPDGRYAWNGTQWIPR